jgi:hypothetical protein
MLGRGSVGFCAGIDADGADERKEKCCTTTMAATRNAIPASDKALFNQYRREVCSGVAITAGAVSRKSLAVELSASWGEATKR